MDHVLRAMLEEFDKGYELLRKMEGGKRVIANIIDRGIIIGMCQYDFSAINSYSCSVTFIDV